MALGCRVSALALASSLWLVALPSRAEWLSNGTPIATQPAEQGYPRLATDGSDGAFVCWNPGNATSWIFCQHLTAEGNYAPGWPAVGRIVPPGVVFENHWGYDLAAVAPDGEGGLYVVSYGEGPWCGNGCSLDPVQVYVQRLSPKGLRAPGWPSEGLLIDAGWLNHDYSRHNLAAAVDDGKHGVLIAWAARGQYGSTDPAVIVQSVGPDGTRHWGENGLEIRRGAGLLSDPVLVADGVGGALVFWGVFDAVAARARVFGQHISAAGKPLWQTNGAPLSHAAFARFEGPVAVPDGKQGAIVSWAGSRGSDLDIYAARVTRSGDLPWGRELRLCSARGDQFGVRMIPIRGDGAVAAWLDMRQASGQSVFAQHVTRDGRTEWTGDGVPVCTAAGTRGPLALASDGRDGAYVAWGDSRPQGELYATHLTSDGAFAPGWPVDGALVSEWQPTYYPNDRSFGGLDMVAIQEGEAVVAWQDARKAGEIGPDIDESFAMLLAPEGPAVVPGGARIVHPQDKPVSSIAAPPARPEFALWSLRPNPASGRASVHFVLPESAPATLGLFDVSGREIWSREIGALGAGEHEVRLGEGAPLPPGVYLVRLAQGERTAVTRLAVVR